MSRSHTDENPDLHPPCRRIAGNWLQQNAETMGDLTAADHLRTAADHYSQLAAECMKDLDYSWSLAVGPDRFDDLTSAMRQEQIARLEAAREHDRGAIMAIEKALAI